MPTIHMLPSSADLSGAKDDTIQAARIRPHATAGQALQLYSGMRIRYCRLILRTACTKALPFRVRWRLVVEVHAGGERIAVRDASVLSAHDDFGDFNDMERFWQEKHPGIYCFAGALIRWQRLEGGL